MIWGAIGLYAIYLLVAFVARTVIQIRCTGDSGFRGLSGRPGSPEWWAGVLFGIALIVGVAAPIAGLIGLPTLAELDHPAVNRAGLVTALAGIALTLAAQLRMGSEWRIGVDATERTQLVTDGLFSVVRNPIFTAMGVTGLGLTLMVPNPMALTGLAALVVALQLQVRVVEEPYLRSLHGSAYTSYETATGRFLPQISRGDRPANPTPTNARRN